MESDKRGRTLNASRLLHVHDRGEGRRRQKQIVLCVFAVVLTSLNTRGQRRPTRRNWYGDSSLLRFLTTETLQRPQIHTETKLTDVDWFPVQTLYN
ncbi:hypothetical protein F2P81_012456 [Scophthalmus maximus]|uniref:Uncharacterized protein n=1 Tax=Scophthalmus maximus TaxID=52904 RepID=A0A6A4SRF1_SCOMX|nr:hypothetical protein F2P81_012456 [Scophthalmus maximus]